MFDLLLLAGVIIALFTIHPGLGIAALLLIIILGRA